MLGTIAADVSSWQRPVDDTYPRDWLIFRLCDGDYIDDNFAANYAWAVRAAGLGKIAGFTVYCVYEPGVDVVAIAQRHIPNPDTHMTFMLDVERWGGKITGNHSPEILGRLNDAAAWLGDRDRVLVYANGGDFAELFPNRGTWVRLIVAGYGTVQPSTARMVGWQYSDGSTRWPVPTVNGVLLPRTSAPFGACDHNYFPNLTPAQLAQTLGVAEEDPLANLTDQQLKQIAEAVTANVWSAMLPESSSTGAPAHQMSTYLVQAWRASRAVSDDTTSILQILGSASSGLLQRVASVQSNVAGLHSAVAGLQSAVKALEPVTAVALDTAAVAKAAADAVTAQLRAFVWGVK